MANKLISILFLFTFIVGCTDSTSTQDIKDSDSLFIDIRDGEKYKIVKIGTQTWFAENLRYSGSLLHIGGEEWIKAGENKNPAWCFYNNVSTYNLTYGKLYNWHAVSFANLAPTGWHIPTDADWSTLINYLGGVTLAGYKMKDINSWDGDNSSGFRAVPGGICNNEANFFGLSEYGMWWSSSNSSENTAMCIGIFTPNINIYDVPKSIGLSVRCIKD